MLKRQKYLKIPAISTAFFLLFFCLSACTHSTVASAGKQTERGFFLNTVIELTIYGDANPDVFDSCFELCAEYEDIFSRTSPESELYKLNASGGGPVSSELGTVLARALEYCRESDGRFDISMGGVSALYGFSDPEPSVPSPDVLASALSHVGWDGLALDGAVLTMSDPETVIDLGAIAKGYIADKLKEHLLSLGVESATINLGGNVLCLGSKPDGSSFRVGIRRPEHGSAELITAVELNDMSVVTSGVYERCFESGGKVYHHLLDPRTGLPIENGLLSVTVISEKSVDGDALSTSLFAMGLEDGMNYVNHLDGVWAMFITDDMEIVYSDGFEENFIK